MCGSKKTEFCVYKSSSGLAWAQVEMKLDTFKELSMNACLYVGVSMSVCFLCVVELLIVVLLLLY